jgi:hypothetical protein
VVCLQELAPALVPQLHGPLGRPDDVGEKDCLEDTIDISLLARSGDELFNLVERLHVRSGCAEVKRAG